MRNPLRPMAVPNDWQKLNYHELSKITDFGIGIDLEALASHIQNNGYDASEPIVIFEGQILDGRHKFEAAKMAEEEPCFAEFIGPSAEKYVEKKLLRQHLDTSQRALAGAMLANLSHGGRRKGENFKTSKEVLKNNQTNENTTINKAASTMNVSKASIERAKEVLDKGIPELHQAVKNGDISVTAAANIATKPEEKQKQIVKSMQPVRCARCIRTHQKDPCPMCDELNTPKDPKPRKPKAPSLKFDWKTFNESIRTIRRLVDDLANLGCPERRVKTLRVLDQFEKEIEEWDTATKKP